MTTLHSFRSGASLLLLLYLLSTPLRFTSITPVLHIGLLPSLPATPLSLSLFALVADECG